MHDGLRRDNMTMEIQDTLIVSAMAPPGGGRNNITSRMARHFNVLGIDSFDDELMRTIFQPVIDWHFAKCSFPAEYGKYSRVSSLLIAIFQNDSNSSQL